MMDKLSLKKRIGRRSRLANEGKKRGKLRKSSQSAVETCAALTMAKQQTPRKKKKKKKKTQWKHSREVEEEKEKEHLYFKWILCSGIHLRLSVSGHADTNIVCMNAARRWDRDRGKQVRLWCVCLCLWMWKAAPSITAIRARGLLLILPSIWGQALEPVQKVKRDSRPCGFTVHNNTASLVCRISARRRRDKGSWWKVRLRSLLPDPDAIMVKWRGIFFAFCAAPADDQADYDDDYDGWPTLSSLLPKVPLVNHRVIDQRRSTFSLPPSQSLVLLLFYVSLRICGTHFTFFFFFFFLSPQFSQ